MNLNLRSPSEPAHSDHTQVDELKSYFSDGMLMILYVWSYTHDC